MQKSLSHYKDPFLRYLKEIRGYSQATIKTYETVLRECFEYLEIEEETEPIRVNIMLYRLHIKEQGKSTISKKLSAIRTFVKYLRHTHELNIKLISDSTIKVPSSLPKPVSHRYIEEALKIAEPDQKLIVMALYSLGLRISELTNLRLDDISKSWVRVIGKGNKMRDVPLIEPLKNLIDDYIELNSPKLYLFEKKSQKLSENSLRYRLTLLFNKIGVKVTPHQLRHSYATELLNSGARIADVSELLGHSSMSTTQVYTKLGTQLKMQNYRSAHPLIKDKQ